MHSLLKNLKRVQIDSIYQYPDNPRKGDVKLIAQSLEINGQFQPLIVQESTSYILAGNHTHQAAISLDWEEIDVAFIEVDDERAKKIVLVANRTADLGYYDEIMIAVLLGEMREQDEALLAGTGYTADDADELLANALTQMPDLENETDESRRLSALFLNPNPGSSDPEADLADSLNAGNADKDLLKSVEKSKKKTPPTYEPPPEFVVFHFGDLKAKVARDAYEKFLRGFLADYNGDLRAAGMGAALMVGLDPEVVEPAVAEGSERWL